MGIDIGPQYEPDDHFKADARLHQSAYRAKVLKVGFDQYGNRLTESAGRALLNYYDGLGVREALGQRYPTYSKSRDANMLRGEHIPFNLFAPLIGRPDHEWQAPVMRLAPRRPLMPILRREQPVENCGMTLVRE